VRNSGWAAPWRSLTCEPMNGLLRLVAVSLALITVASSGATSAPNEAPAAEAKGPVAQFSPLAVDFGQVGSAEVKRHDFTVANAGSEPLRILSVNPSCGCTTAGEWDREIAPGKSGRIPIEFNPANFSGVVTKAIVVTTNDPARPTQVLELKANVWRPFQVQPAFANFLPVEGEPSTETKVIRIVYNGEAPAELGAPVCSDGRFKAELKPVLPGKEFELHVTYDSASGAGSPSSTITIKTSLPDQPMLTVTAFAMPQPAIAIVPPAVQLPRGPLNQDYRHNVVIRSNSRTPLSVTEPTVEGQGVTAKLTEAQPGKLYYLNIGVPHDFTAPADGPVVVSVKTSHPKFPVIRIPIVHDRGAAGAVTTRK
jgi:hypothetical protein